MKEKRVLEKESGEIKGVLIPIGGNEDKGSGDNERYTFDFIERGILAHVVKESGGKDAKIVVIPTASSIPVEVGNNYLHAFGQLGCNNVSIMHISKKEHAEKPENLKEIAAADCVMFSGGDQSKIAKRIGGTLMHDMLRSRYLNEKFVIAGTSAGAMCMSLSMISGGSSREALYKGAVKTRKGMGFLPDVIIDSHFISRGRFGRLAEAVGMFPALLGVGLAEDTGVIIRNGHQFEVIGSGMVVLFDPSSLTHNNHKYLKPGVPMSMGNLVVHILENGDKFDVDNRKFKIKPMSNESMLNGEATVFEKSYATD